MSNAWSLRQKGGNVESPSFFLSNAWSLKQKGPGNVESQTICQRIETILLVSCAQLVSVPRLRGIARLIPGELGTLGVHDDVGGGDGEVDGHKGTHQPRALGKTECVWYLESPSDPNQKWVNDPMILGNDPILKGSWRLQVVLSKNGIRFAWISGGL